MKIILESIQDVSELMELIKGEKKPTINPEFEKEVKEMEEAPKKKKAAKKEKEEIKDEIKEEPKANQYTKEDLARAAKTKLKEGKNTEVKAIFEKYGATKLSEIKEEDYDSCIPELEAL